MDENRRAENVPANCYNVALVNFCYTVQMSKTDDAILFYEGEYYMFSNFSAFAVEWRGKVWMKIRKEIA